jgi:hypothetical protein
MPRKIRLSQRLASYLGRDLCILRMSYGESETTPGVPLVAILFISGLRCVNRDIGDFLICKPTVSSLHTLRALLAKLFYHRSQKEERWRYRSKMCVMKLTAYSSVCINDSKLLRKFSDLSQYVLR